MEGTKPPPGYIALIPESEVPDGAFLHIDVKGIDIALGRVDGTLRALSNDCPHAGGPMHKGTLEGTSLTCPWHKWCFDVTTGASSTIKGQVLPVFEVMVEAGVVCIKLDLGEEEGAHERL